MKGRAVRIVRSQADLEEGAAHLARVCPEMRAALAQVGALPLRRKSDGFETLLSAIVSQQVSVASADAIWRRLRAARLTGPRKVLWASDADLAACGLSRQKRRYAKALAEARLDYRALRAASDAEVIETLSAVTGIGVWTAEIYAMFALGRRDVFPAGDLALQEGARVLYGLHARPSARALREMAEPWAPWRAVAARVLWAYYAIEKQREGIR